MNKNKPIDMLFITYFLAASIKKKRRKETVKMWELLRPVQYLFLRRTVELVTAVQASNKLSGIAQLFTSSLSK